MNSFLNLPIWEDLNFKAKLNWYSNVSSNQLPAKFLICKRIPSTRNLKTSNIEELWEEHQKLTIKLLQIKEEITNGNKLDDYEVAEPNLLDLNIELVNRMLKSCNFCEWNCEVDRTIPDTNKEARTGTCQLGESSRVGSYFHHRGEELIFRGTMGSGTIFFTSCNLRCTFCQNGDISKDKLNGVKTSYKDLADIGLLLRLEGCHNLNFVGGDPIVHLHTIIRAIKFLEFRELTDKKLQILKKTKSDRFILYPRKKEYADYRGEFNVPILWNSNFYMTNDALKILRTVVDIWLPDFKFANNKCARRLSRTPRYFETVTKMHKKIDDWGEDYSIRHLIMPNHVECCTKPILDWIKNEIPDAIVNIMAQYHPDSFSNPQSPNYNPRYEDISRFPTKRELDESYRYASNLGIKFEQITFEKSIRV